MSGDDFSAPTYSRAWGAVGLVLFGGGAVWLAMTCFSAFDLLRAHLLEHRLLLKFSTGVVAGAAVVPGIAALAVGSGAYLVGRKIPHRAAVILMALLMASAVGGLAGKLLGPTLVGGYVRTKGYESCAELAEGGRNLMGRAWVLEGHELCREGIDLEGLTLADLDRPEIRARLGMALP
jgi:hypothetical protein